MTTDQPKPMEQEWSYFLKADEITSEEKNVKVEATEAQRKNLASRLDVLSVENAQARFRIKRESRQHVIHVKGVVNATIQQNCAQTMAPVSQQVEDEFEAWFMDHESVISLDKIKRERHTKVHDNEVQMPEEQDDPEMIVGGVIDLGELATQYLSLSLEPYGPRTDDSDEPQDGDIIVSAGPSVHRKNPFEALKDWKNKKS